MKKYNKYLRPYCKKCVVIYSMIKNIGLKNCTHCGKPLQFKSFNPYPSCIFGIFILILAISTLVISLSPIIWIGGFIWGAYQIFEGLSNWEEVKKLDKF